MNHNKNDTSAMTDEDWENFKKWWIEKWMIGEPDRWSVEQYIQYNKSKENER